MIDLLNLTLEELTSFVTGLGEPRYRAGQIYKWMCRGIDIDSMTDISKKTREKLSENAFINFPSIERKLVSDLDGTVKYLFALRDGQCVESVVMKYNHGNTICVSSQAGCRMGCKFCASTINGLARNLEPSEILGQIITAQKDTGERIQNIVMMGIGEPLDNYDNVVKFLRLVSSENGLNIGCRHISLSTCGLVDKIYRLADEDIPLTLSISLHAVTDAERSELMPVNNKWGLAELLTACSDYFKRTGRRISFEYTLIKDKNDTHEHASRLAGLLKKYMPDMPLHVNLIPVNEVTERGLKPSSRSSVDAFVKFLSTHGINATVRRKLGSDIDASCGQLRLNKQQQI